MNRRKFALGGLALVPATSSLLATRAADARKKKRKELKRQRTP